MIDHSAAVAGAGSLKRRAALSTFWSVSQVGSDQIFNLVIYVFLARLLTPADFGVIVLAGILVELGRIVGAGAMTSAIMRAPTISARLLDSIFWGNLAISMLLAAIYALFGGAIARLLGSDGDTAGRVIAVLGLAVPIAALGTTHMTVNLRQFGHRSLAIRSVAAGLIGGSLGLTAAFAGWGVWSLVVQRLTVEMIGTVVAWLSYRWRPGFDVSWSTLRRDGLIGLAGSASLLLTVAVYRGQDLLVARFFSTATLGAFRNGSKLNEILAQGVVGPMASVGLPMLSGVQHDRSAFQRAFRGMVEACALLVVPSVVGIGVLAPDLVPLLYGPQWATSIGVVRVLSFVALPFAIGQFFLAALLVFGRSQLILRLMIGHLIGMIGAGLIGAPHGLLTLVAAFVVNEYAWLAIRMWTFARVTASDLRPLLRILLPPVVAALVMAGVLLVLQRLPGGYFAPAPTGQVRRIALMIPLGAIVYAVSLLGIGGRGLHARVWAAFVQIRTRQQVPG